MDGRLRRRLERDAGGGDGNSIFIYDGDTGSSRQLGCGGGADQDDRKKESTHACWVSSLGCRARTPGFSNRSSGQLLRSLGNRPESRPSAPARRDQRNRQRYSILEHTSISRFFRILQRISKWPVKR